MSGLPEVGERYGRYQISRLQEMFGDDLRDREARVELILALRVALPEWEAEAREPR